MKKFLLYISFLFIVHCTLKIEDCKCQWYQINLPVSGSVNQMQFINSNTGWATVKQTSYIYSLIRTTNQGTNWQVIYSDSEKVSNFQFINDTLGYAMGYSYLQHLILKTTNGGDNWTIMQSSGSYVFSGFYMINKDTGWVSAFLFPTQVTLITTDGFQTLQQISTGGGGTPSTLYFFKEKYNEQYCGYISGSGTLFKTTNSGYNWQQINTGIIGNVQCFSFINKDTGWITEQTNTGHYIILNTINNGSNWNVQYNDPVNYYQPYTIFAINSNLIYCALASYNNKIFISTNFGNNWGNQFCPISSASNIYMIDSLTGFAWSNLIVKTINGGGPFNSIERISESISTEFKLKQNYPNPFNSSTVIEFDIPKTSTISLIIYDILGREDVKVIESKELEPGSYKTLLDLNNYNLSSGIYFCKLIAIEKNKGDIFEQTKKLIYNK